jgi:peptidoglycan hydrolase-like protein with peptidoglycan-binding domain
MHTFDRAGTRRVRILGVGWRVPTIVGVAAALAATIMLVAPPSASAAIAPVRLTSSSCPVTIKQGQTSGCVTELQNLLNGYGAHLTVDSIFGAATYRAVRSFQSSAGIAVDGLVGPQTKSKLYSSRGTTPAAIPLDSQRCPATVQQGQTSGCVTELQRLLVKRGYDVAMDGVFGSGTLAAVKAFQGAIGITVDGLVGPVTKSRLYGAGGDPAPSAINLRSSACPATIQQGQYSGCVTTLQSLLNGKGQSVTVDGSFGPATLAAVKAFQSAAGLTVDGLVGPNTKAALYSNIDTGNGSGAPAPINLTSSSCPATIQQGQTSGCVTELQSLLNHHGASLVVDGIFGALTALAVRDFQSEKGLTADALVGPNTKAALYGAVTPPSSSPAPGGGYQQILSIAAAEVGTREGSARANAYGVAVGYSQSTSRYAWCATFVSWVMMQTGATSYRSAAVGNWVAKARAGSYGLSVVSTPAPGDIVAFDWDGNGDYAVGNRHIGLVEKLGSGGTFYTIEGNTGDPNGGSDGVFRKTRSTSNGYNVIFIRVR